MVDLLIRVHNHFSQFFPVRSIYGTPGLNMLHHCYRATYLHLIVFLNMGASCDVVHSLNSYGPCSKTTTCLRSMRHNRCLYTWQNTSDREDICESTKRISPWEWRQSLMPQKDSIGSQTVSAILFCIPQ